MSRIETGLLIEKEATMADGEESPLGVLAQNEVVVNRNAGLDDYDFDLDQDQSQSDSD